MYLKTIASLVSISTLSMLATTRASADNQKTYSAAECVTVAGSTPISYNSSAWAYNWGTTSTNAMCPIINDKDSSLSVLTTVDVYAQDRHATEGVECRLVEHIDNWVSWGPAVSTGGNSTQSQRLRMQNGGNMGIALHAYCTIPAPYAVGTTRVYSAIQQYTVVETN
jgi:hypothetical protein